MNSTSQLLVRIDEKLSSIGDVRQLAGHVDVASYELGDHVFGLPQGIDYELNLTNAGEGILASGLVRSHVEGVCDRCLEAATFELASELNELYLFEEPISDDEAQDDYALVGPDDTIDLSDAIIAALVMDTPYVVLCKDDCKGLCPHCGANLNEGPCGCKEHEQAAADSPFAALSSLSFDEEPPEELV